MWLNGLFLFTISFTPFPTSLLGTFPQLHGSATLLALVMFATASSFSLMRWYATYPGRLIRTECIPAARNAMRSSLIGPILYASAIVVAQVSTMVSIAIQIIVPVLFVFPIASVAQEQG